MLIAVGLTLAITASAQDASTLSAKDFRSATLTERQFTLLNQTAGDLLWARTKISHAWTWIVVSQAIALKFPHASKFQRKPVPYDRNHR